MLAAESKQIDCLPCRILGILLFSIDPALTATEHLAGAGAFVGLGTYTYFSGHSQLLQQEAMIRQSGSIFGMKSRRASITGLALGMVGMGLYRLVN